MPPKTVTIWDRAQTPSFTWLIMRPGTYALDDPATREPGVLLGVWKPSTLRPLEWVLNWVELPDGEWLDAS